MVYGEVGQSYVSLARPDGATLVGKLTNVLKFTVKEIDPTTGNLRPGWSKLAGVLKFSINKVDLTIGPLNPARQTHQHSQVQSQGG